MKDLRLFNSIENALNFNNELKHSTFDNTSRCLYTCDNLKLIGVDTTDGQVNFNFDLYEAKCSDNESNSIIGIQYLTEMNNIFIANAKGDLMILNIFDQQVECVGCIIDGIAAVDWSPDQELLVIISETNNMLLMSKDFNLINEQSIDVQDFGEAKFINVGWGKKETQFHGSEGKEAAKKIVKIGEASYEWDDKKPRVSWRTDAEFYLVHTLDKTRDLRKFQVFTREGVLHSTSEFVASLESSIVWKNSKAHITSSTHKANKHEIVFYERNGLSHGSFTLPFPPKEFKVNEILWNNDSTVLCIWLERLSKNDNLNNEIESLIQLWTVGNYHWYLKHSINFSMKNKITSVLWDPEAALQLHILTAGGNYIKKLFGWTVHNCRDVSDYNGSVGVIDGYDLLITHFKEAVIPPPMCAYKIHCNLGINDIIWSPNNLDFIVQLMNNELLYYKYQIESSLDSKKLEIVAARDFKPDRYKVHKLITRFRLTNNNGIQQILWLNERELAVIQHESNTTRLVIYNMNMTNNESVISVEIKNTFKLDSPILNTAFNTLTKTLALQLINGEIYKYNTAASKLEKWLFDATNNKFPQPCAYFSICSKSDNKSEEICVGLTDFFRLYINNKEVSNNCTSFYIHDRYILFSTHANSLKFIDLNKIDTANVIEEACRRLERGSKIVTCLHNDTTCILQMPRGNLETIHPRTLVIAKLKHHINNHQYRDTIESMRKHRINMNLIYDHNPKQFLDNIQSFIEQIDNVNLLNLFITELSNENVTTGLYKSMYQYTIEENNNKKQESKTNEIDKINLICEQMILMLEKLNPIRYFLAILSCHAKKNDLDEALKKIMKHKLVNEYLADEGLRHLLYLVDVNRLFDIALGTYDFNIVIMVAEKSQKDPKEYLPFLNELQKLEENYRKYKIDLHLKRYKKALESIVKCYDDHYDELIKLINEQKLYSDALGYFQLHTDAFKDISKHFATYLSNKKYYQEAGLVLFRASLYNDSLDAFEKSNDCKMYLCACSQLNLQKAEYNDKLQKIISNLKDSNKYAEVAAIYEQYLNDFESAIENLILGLHWNEALRLIHKYKRFDFLETSLLPAIKTQQQEILNELRAHRTNILNHTDRLVQVRIEKAEKNLREQLEFNDEIPENDDMSQLSSVMDDKSTTGTVKSSATSINSQFSSRTTRNKNKMKKKAVSLKKGSANEDLALIQELSDIISIVYKTQESIVSLIQILLVYNMVDLCNSLQIEYENLISLIDKNLPIIWTNLIISNENNENLKPNESDYGKLDLKYRYPPISIISKTSWKLHLKE